MSREIRKTNEVIYHITSQPGDLTKYDYFVYKNYDNYSFMPRLNSFVYPNKKLNYFEYEGILNDEEKLLKKANVLNVNPHTLKECLNTMEILQKEI